MYLHVSPDALNDLVAFVLSRHLRGRVRTDRDGFHRTDCSCGWAGSPWQRDDRFRDEQYELITARQAMDGEWRTHVAAAVVAALLDRA